MARPSKIGIDWFPFDVGTFDDDKFYTLMLDHGYLAPYLYILLISLIYADKGYYIECDEKARPRLLKAISRRLAGSKYPVKPEKIWEIIVDMTACELFSLDCFMDKQILTSKRIQKEYYNTTSKRKHIVVIPDYWLLSVEEMESISLRSPILSFLKIDVNNSVSDVNNSVSESPNSIEQSRAEQMRGEESRLEEMRGEESVSELNRDMYDLHEHQRHEFFENRADAVDDLSTVFQQLFQQGANRNVKTKIAAALASGWSHRQIYNLVCYISAEVKPDNPCGYLVHMLNSASSKSFDY